MCIAYRELRARDRLMNDISDDVMRDVMMSVTAQESRQLAADFHLTDVVQRLDLLRQCRRVVEMSCCRTYFSIWKTRLSCKSIIVI